jgi:hypothetical protein
MAKSFPDLANQTKELNDEELLSRYAYTTLSDEARTIARAEIWRRGLALPATPIADRAPVHHEDGDDFELVARFLNPTDAHLARSALAAAGIPAILADANLVQANSLWSIALGGARVLVPARYHGDAEAIMKALERGDFALSDDDPAIP